MPREIAPRIAVVLGYVCVAVAFSWPLPLHLETAVTGPPGGDTGVYVWNQWVFHQEVVVDRSYPMRTGRILSLTDRVDLSQHNYTVFLNLLALPLMSWLGVVATFNLVWLAAMVITACCTYALARQVTAANRLEAWLAGLAFAWSPALVARTTGHFSLVAAAPLAAFLLFLVRADRSRRPVDAALAGLCMAWAGFSDPYYAVYCLVITGGYVAGRAVRLRITRESAPRFLRWTLNVLIVIVGGLVLGLIVGRGGRFELLGIPISVRGLYTPMFVLTVLVLVRAAVALRPHVGVVPRTVSPQALRALVVGVLACAGPLAPVLYGLGERLADGRYVSPPILWRSSPRGVDLLALFSFNPNHPLARWFDDQQVRQSVVFVEYTAALSLVALAVVVIAAWRAGYRPHAGWLWLTGGFAALALGPFIYVAGVNTHVPGPWALLRYVPLIDAARTPTRFAIVAALGVSVLLAGALAALGRRFPERRRAITGLAGVLLLVELLPAPRTLYSAESPSVMRTIAADPRPVRVLHLPFGVRDGTFSIGNFSAEYLFHQTVHGKRLIGGYLSRISNRRVKQLRRQPTLDALVTLSEGGTLSPAEAARIRARAKRFLRRTNLGYVVVDEARTPAGLLEFVTQAWRLELIARDRGLALYRPRLIE